jgi:hypothetical protein
VPAAVPGRLCPGGALAAASAAHRQALLALQPVQLLVVHGHAHALEQDAEPPVTEATPLAGEGTQPLAYGLVAAALRPAYRFIPTMRCFDSARL